MSEQVQCSQCGREIQKATAEKHRGRCAVCAKGGSFSNRNPRKSPIVAIGLIVFGIAAWVLFLTGASVPWIGLALPVIGLVMLVLSLSR